MSENLPGTYAGDVTVRAAWDDLEKSPMAALIDVRTTAEWAYVGMPVLSSIGKSTVPVEWDRFPSGDLVPDFPGRLKTELDKHGAGPDAPLYFICRSGNRSKHAAIAATASGYRRCFNVRDGFEGRLGPNGQRGTAGSWKAEGLPWVQS